MNLKEKIKKSFKPCKRLKLLEYNEFLEKEELQDTPTSRAMYCEYKSQVDEKNQKADMELSKKIGGVLFAFVVTIVIICLFVNQISATTYIPRDVLNTVFNSSPVVDTTAIVTDYEGFAFNDYSYSFLIQPLYCYGVSLSDSTHSFYISNLEAFQGLCEYRNITTYAQWQSYVTSNYPSYDDDSQKPPLNGYYFDNQIFLTALNYNTITETDLQNAKTEGIFDSIEVAQDTLTFMGIYTEPYANNGTLSTLDSMLLDNIGTGLQNSNTTGYNSGLAQGKNNYINSQEYQEVLTNKYQEGFADGEATAPVVESSLRAYFNAPINFISNILNFEIFGINLWAVFTFITTLGLIFFVIRKVVGL